jgi:hypothetical protein
MNDRRADGAVHHHQFEQVPGPVRPKDQPADRVVANFVDGDSVDDGVVDIFARDAMAQGRAENLRLTIVLRNCQGCRQGPRRVLP